MAATSILRSAARSSALARSSQGNSQASPQLEDSLRGTGAMRAPIPASLQDRSNSSAMLVVLNVARQLNKTHFPSQKFLLKNPFSKNVSKKRLSHRLSPHQVVLTSGFSHIQSAVLGTAFTIFPGSVHLGSVLPDLILPDSLLPGSTQDYNLRRLLRNSPVFRPERQKGQGTYIMKDKGESFRGHEARGKTHLLEGAFSAGAPKGGPSLRFTGVAAFPTAFHTDRTEADPCFF